MRKVALMGLLWILVAMLLQNAAATQASTPGLVTYCFTSGFGSKSNCAGLVTTWIGRANSTVHVLIYSFTLATIRDSLLDAKNRKVDVKVVMDKQQAKDPNSQYLNLTKSGLTVRLHNGASEMHNKVAIIDGHIIVTGSFNWSKSANESNDENLVVLDSGTWAAAYEQQFQQVWNAAT